MGIRSNCWAVLCTVNKCTLAWVLYILFYNSACCIHFQPISDIMSLLVLLYWLLASFWVFSHFALPHWQGDVEHSSECFCFVWGSHIFSSLDCCHCCLLCCCNFHPKANTLCKFHSFRITCRKFTKIKIYPVAGNGF